MRYNSVTMSEFVSNFKYNFVYHERQTTALCVCVCVKFSLKLEAEIQNVAAVLEHKSIF